MAMASVPACAASELVAKGRESAAVLKAMLGQLLAGPTTPHGPRDLAEQILLCCDRALAALHSGSGTAGTEEASSSRKRKQEREGLAAPPSPNGSKRMRTSRGERGTRVEKKGTMEDGFMWRKYGQKDINGSNYPRLYFRCTYKDDRGCLARRQVQQSDTDPSVYLITYFDEHTCYRDDNDAIDPATPFVINFGLSTAAAASDDQPSGSPWPSCDGGSGQVEALCSSPEEELQTGTSCNVAEFIITEQSTPVPELMGMMTFPEWDRPMDGCLGWEWEIGNGEISSFDIIDDFVRYDFDYIDLLYNRKNA